MISGNGLLSISKKCACVAESAFTFIAIQYCPINNSATDFFGRKEKGLIKPQNAGSVQLRAPRKDALDVCWKLGILNKQHQCTSVQVTLKKRNVLLKVTRCYTANTSSLCSWAAVVGTQSTAFFTWGKGRDCSISVQTDRSVDRHQYHHQEWHLCTILFPRMHGQVFPQRTDIFQASLWTK